jgi:hypothetical protein
VNSRKLKKYCGIGVDTVFFFNNNIITVIIPSFILQAPVIILKCIINYNLISSSLRSLNSRSSTLSPLPKLLEIQTSSHYFFTFPHKDVHIRSTPKLLFSTLATIIPSLNFRRRMPATTRNTMMKFESLVGLGSSSV